MLDAIILSDIHLGSEISQAHRLCEFLAQIEEGELTAQTLILNGDVFDSIDFRRLKKHHWKVLSLLRKLSDQMDIIWICGNHDGPAEIVSQLLGLSVRDEFVLKSGGERILVLHGHTFDEFIDAHPFLTWFADCIYAVFQWMDRTHGFAKWAKRSSKKFLRCSNVIRDKSIAYARQKKYTSVVCGHTHLPCVDHSGEVSYFNTGCWTEMPGTYITVLDGSIELCSFETKPAAEVLSLPIREFAMA